MFFSESNIFVCVDHRAAFNFRSDQIPVRRLFSSGGNCILWHARSAFKPRACGFNLGFRIQGLGFRV